MVYNIHSSGAALADNAPLLLPQSLKAAPSWGHEPYVAATMTTQSQAKRIFLELGKGGRSLRKVQAALREQGDSDVPTLRVLGDWSGKGEWIKAAEEWDANAQADEPAPVRPLTAKQQRFVEEYLVDLNATQASIRAGYSAKTAEQQGPRLLGNVGVAAAIKAAQEERSQRTKVTQDWVLDRLVENVERSMQVEPVIGRDGKPTGQFTYQGSVANKALELLGKHVDLFTERHEHRAVVGVVSPPSGDELAAMLGSFGFDVEESDE